MTTIAFHSADFVPGFFTVCTEKLGTDFELGTYTVDGIDVGDDHNIIYATAETIKEAESAILKHYFTSLIGDGSATVQEACSEIAKIERRYS